MAVKMCGLMKSYMSNMLTSTVLVAAIIPMTVAPNQSLGRSTSSDW